MLKRFLIATLLAAAALQPVGGFSDARAVAGSSSRTIPDDTPVSKIDVSGKVRLVENGSGHVAADSSRVAIWLAALGAPDTLPRPTSARTHFRMLQRNKTFDPALLVVPLGSIVDFPNLDPWFHNVFSLYQGKRFDLGLYQAGSEKQVVFDRPGPSFLFCNIHPQMAAVILTVDSDLFGVSDKSGRVLIPQVPAGHYKMHVWYENAAPEFVDAGKTIEVSAAENVLPPVSIPVTRHDRAHKDKYGNDYDPKASSPAY
jgi:plastocyanin